MASSIPSNPSPAAPRTLPRDVLDQLKRRPGARLPREMWRRLTPEQRAMVRAARENGRDGFGAQVDPAAVQRAAEQATGQKSEAPRFMGVDPIGAIGPDESSVGPLPTPSAPHASVAVPVDAAPPPGAPVVAPVAPVAPAPSPNPVTGLDPASMHELFAKLVDTTGLDNFQGQALLDELRKRVYSKHIVLDYHAARQAMFSQVDDHNGVVKSVYGEQTIHGGQIPRADGPSGFNTEHTWPQSQLKAAGKAAAVTDLNHLFPVDTVANGKRANLPFGVVKQVVWQNGESQLGYDDKGQLVFMPPKEHRGNVARAMLWIATAYQLQIPHDEEAVLKEWAKEDPVDAAEVARTLAVAKVQGDPNPYVLMPELIDRIPDV